MKDRTEVLKQFHNTASSTGCVRFSDGVPCRWLVDINNSNSGICALRRAQGLTKMVKDGTLNKNDTFAYGKDFYNNTTIPVVSQICEDIEGAAQYSAPDYISLEFIYPDQVAYCQQRLEGDYTEVMASVISDMKISPRTRG